MRHPFAVLRFASLAGGGALALAALFGVLAPAPAAAAPACASVDPDGLGRSTDGVALKRIAEECAAFARGQGGARPRLDETVYPAFIAMRAYNRIGDIAGRPTPVPGLTPEAAYCEASRLSDETANRAAMPPRNERERKSALQRALVSGRAVERAHALIGLSEAPTQACLPGRNREDMLADAIRTAAPASDDLFYYEFLFLRARAYAGLGGPGGDINARRDLETVAASNSPLRARATAELANFKTGCPAGDAFTAELAVTAIVAIENSQVKDFDCLGRAYHIAGRYGDSWRAFERVSPRTAASFAGAGKARQAGGDARGAVRDYESAKNLEPTTKRRIDYAKALAAAQDLRQAEIAFTAVATETRSIEAYEAWIAFLESQGKDTSLQYTTLRGLYGGSPPNKVQLRILEASIATTTPADVQAVMGGLTGADLADARYLLGILALKGRGGGWETAVREADLAAAGGAEKHRSLQCLANLARDFSGTVETRTGAGYCAGGGTAEAMLLKGLYAIAVAGTLPVGRREAPLREARNVFAGGRQLGGLDKPPTFAALVGPGMTLGDLLTFGAAESEVCLGANSSLPRNEWDAGKVQRARAFLASVRVSC